MKITYTMQGDYLLPNLTLPEQDNRPIGLWGQQHLRYIKRSRHILYTNLLTKCKLKHKWYSDRKQTTIWEFDKPKKNGDHPTMKPVPLIAYPIKNSSVANCIVLDPFGGSGSTLIACEQTNRICCTSELDEKYCDVIVKRYIEQVGTTKNVYVVRDGQTIKFDDLEVSADEQ